VLVKVRSIPRRLGTLARFEAVDPWHGQRTSFSIESYALVPERITAPEAWPAYAVGARRLHGIRSEADGVERMLPASLVALWQGGEATPEALPGLLHGLESELRETDLLPPSQVPALPAALVCLLAAALGLVVLPGALARHQAALILGAGFAVVLGPLFALLLLVVVWPRERRRRRQMARARALLAGATA
jgi:hypothetical protein